MSFFSSGSNQTLLLVTQTEVIRADFVGGKTQKLKAMARDTRPPKSHITTAAELAASLIDAKPSQRTTLICDEFWTGILDIDERSIYGLAGEELAQMLRFESESLSNLDPMSCRLGFVEMAPVPPDTRRFWCTGVPGEVVHSVGEAISVRGGRLFELANPAGLAGPEGHQVPWVEFRAGVAGAFATTAKGLPRASITRVGRQTDRWYRSLETNFGTELPFTGWIDEGVDSPDSYQGQLAKLHSDESMESWLTRVAQRMVSGDLIPRVAPPPPETSANTFKMVGTAATILAALIGLGTYYAGRRELSSIATQIDALKEPANEKRRLDGEIRAVAKQVDKLNEEKDQVEADQQKLRTLDGRNDRYSRMLELVAGARDEHLVVDAIKISPVGLELTGRAFRSESPNQLAMAISPEARQLGWKLSAPKMEGQNKLTNGGPWDFTLSFIDCPIPASAGEGVSGANAFTSVFATQEPGR